MYSVKNIVWTVLKAVCYSCYTHKSVCCHSCAVSQGTGPLTVCGQKTQTAKPLQQSKQAKHCMKRMERNLGVRQH